MGFFQGTKERVRNRGRRAISVRATEVLLYMITSFFMLQNHVCFTVHPAADDTTFCSRL